MIATVFKQRAAYLPALLFAGKHVASFAQFRLPQVTISADRSPFSHNHHGHPQTAGDSSSEKLKRSNGPRLKRPASSTSTKLRTLGLSLCWEYVSYISALVIRQLLTSIPPMGSCHYFRLIISCRTRSSSNTILVDSSPVTTKTIP